MNKLTAITCLSAFLMAPIAAQADWNGNWVAGISGGYNWLTTEFDVTVDIPNGPSFFQDHKRLNGNDWSIGVLGGYQVQCDGWLYGAELSLDWANNNHTQNYAFTGDTVVGPVAFNTVADYKNDATIALTGRVGYQMLSWLMPYARAGIETGRNKLNVSIDESSEGATFNTEASNRSYRFVGGVGVEMPLPLFCAFTLRAEYNYHAGNRTLNQSAAWDAPAIASSTITSSGHANSVKASLVYNFGI